MTLVFIQNDRNIDNHINHRIQVGWLKWWSVMRVLCDCNIPFKIEGKVLLDCCKGHLVILCRKIGV